MRYLGGKTVLSKSIASFLLESLEYHNFNYFEPFVGGLSVISEVGKTHKGCMYASDVCKPLITLYQSIKEGWEPPDVVTEQDYIRYKKIQDPYDPMTAFVGFGCSFGGKWFGGYARSTDSKGDPVNFASTTKRSLRKSFKFLDKTVFKHKRYQDCTPKNLVVYCDPPYADTTKYDYSKNFDHSEFWGIMRQWASKNIVYVSEFQAPEFCEEVWRKERKISVAKKDYATKVDKLFRVHP